MFSILLVPRPVGLGAAPWSCQPFSVIICIGLGDIASCVRARAVVVFGAGGAPFITVSIRPKGCFWLNRLLVHVSKSSALLLFEDGGQLL